MFKLPIDDIAADNACIWKYSRKWPLFVDPQEQVDCSPSLSVSPFICVLLFDLLVYALHCCDWQAAQWIREIEEEFKVQKETQNKERGIDKKKSVPSGLQIIKASSTEMGAEEQQVCLCVCACGSI